jgi:hypothetical protein
MPRKGFLRCFVEGEKGIFRNLERPKRGSRFYWRGLKKKYIIRDDFPLAFVHRNVTSTFGKRDMSKHKVFSKILFATLRVSLAVLVCMGGLVLLLESYVHVNTPVLSELLKGSPSPLAVLSFHAPEKAFEALHLFASDVGFLPSFKETEGTDAQRGVDSDLGFRSYLMTDVEPTKLLPAAEKLDVLYGFLRDYQEIIAESETSEDEEFLSQEEMVPDSLPTPEDDEISADYADSPFAKPMQNFIEEIWNGPALKLNQVVEFEGGLFARLKLGLLSLFKERDESLKDALISVLPDGMGREFVFRFFDDIYFNATSESAQGIHHGMIHLQTGDLEELFELLCPENELARDFCSNSSLEREKIRSIATEHFDLLGDHFEIRLHFYWSWRGRTLLFSNHREWLESSLASQDTLLGWFKGVLRPRSKLPAFEPDTGNGWDVSISTSLNLPMAKERISELSMLLYQISNSNDLQISEYFTLPSVEQALSALEYEAHSMTAHSEFAAFSLLRHKGFLESMVSVLPALDSAPDKDDVFLTESEELYETYTSWLGERLCGKLTTQCYDQMNLKPVKSQLKTGWFKVSSKVATREFQPFLQRERPQSRMESHSF